MVSGSPDVSLTLMCLPVWLAVSGWRCPALWTSSLVSVDWFPGGVRLSRCLSYPHVSPSLAGGVWLAVSGSLDVLTCLCRLVSRWCPALQMSLFYLHVSPSLAGGVWLAVSGSLDVFTCLCRLVSRWCPALQMSLLPSCVSQSGWRCLAGGVRLFGRLHLSPLICFPVVSGSPDVSFTFMCLPVWLAVSGGVRLFGRLHLSPLICFPVASGSPDVSFTFMCLP